MQLNSFIFVIIELQKFCTENIWDNEEEKPKEWAQQLQELINYGLKMSGVAQKMPPHLQSFFIPSSIRSKIEKVKSKINAY